MKKVLLALAVVAASAGGAGAETALLPTEALKPGHVEFQVDYSWERWRPNLRADGDAKLKNETLSSTATFGVGVAKGLQLNVSVPYIWKERAKAEGQGEEGYLVDRDGIGDITVGGFVSIGERKKLLASIGLDVKLDTAPVGEGGLGKVEYTPQVGVSYGMGHAIPYITYRPTFRTDEKNKDTSHEVIIGSEFEISQMHTLDAKLFAEVGETEAAAGRMGLDLAAYLGITNNIYLLPRASVFYVTPTRVESEIDEVRAGDTIGYGAGLALYVTY